MKKMKKVVAMLLALAMVLGMSIMTYGATVQNADHLPRDTDKADITISGITGAPTVTLYQIVKGDYATTNGKPSLKGYVAIDGVNIAEITENISSAKILEIATGLTGAGETAATLRPFATYTDQSVGATYTKELPAGVYIAVLTGATDGSIYNPLILSVAYSSDADSMGVIQGGTINLPSGYINGSTAVAKKTDASIDKGIVGGTTPDGDKKTASVGDEILFAITPTMPTYPNEATNKTFYVTDQMSEGLTFDYDSLNVSIEGAALTRTGNYTFTDDNGTVVANAAKNDNGFRISFVYDALTTKDTEGNFTGVKTPIVTYSAILNDKAVVGTTGNPNDAKLYYANEPLTGNTYDDLTKDPQEGSGIEKVEDKEVVYTYQLSFKKTGENNEVLADAVFGIFADKACTILIDQVTTNSDGYAVSSKVSAGTYYVKELQAPAGYSLNETVYEIEASWTSSKTTTSGIITEREYTTNKAEAVNETVVGYLKNGVFYKTQVEGSEEAYLKSEKVTTNVTVDETKNEAGAGTTFLPTPIPNTKLTGLPSTGGIGTTIFTIGGCLIMIVAAGLFFASRKKTQK